MERPHIIAVDASLHQFHVREKWWWEFIAQVNISIEETNPTTPASPPSHSYEAVAIGSTLSD